MKKETAKKLLKKVVEDYDSIADSFNTSRQYDWKEFDLYLPYIKNGDKVADLGCGNGRFYTYIKDKKEVTYVGIDNSKNLLQKAKNNTRGKFKDGDLIKIPLEHDSIDTAIAIASFHHLPSKELRKKSLNEIKRVLKKDGKFIVSVWNLFQAKYKKYIWKARFKSIMSFGKYDMRDTLIPWGKSGVNRYYYAFTAKELRKLLEKSGFKIIKEYQDRNFTFICQLSQ